MHTLLYYIIFFFFIFTENWKYLRHIDAYLSAFLLYLFVQMDLHTHHDSCIDLFRNISFASFLSLS